jgi:4-hydroxybenzoate polyprenyltransferase
MRYLNIEVVLGILSIAFLAQFTLGTQLPFEWFLIVPTATWAVYTLDRIADVVRDDPEFHSDRHLFHLRNKQKLVLGVSLALLMSLVAAILFFPVEYWLIGICIGSLTSMHYFLHFTRSSIAGVVKDVNVALTFNVAAWSIPWYMADSMRLDALIVFVSVTLLIVADVTLLSLIEYDADSARGTSSIAVAFGRKSSLHFVRILSFVALGITTWGFLTLNLQLPLVVVISAMASYYFAMSVLRFSSQTLARFCYESGLLIPLFLLLL